MDRSIRKNGLINLLSLVLIAAASFAVARVSNSMAGQVATVFLAIGVLVAAISWFQMRLEENERLEKLELEELAKSKTSSTLFEGRDAELFPAQRSRQQFERFFVPIFTGILFLAQAITAFFLWRWLTRSTITVELHQQTVAMALFALFALVLFLLGKFSATIARLDKHPLLRPGASWLLFGAYASAAVTIGIVVVVSEYPDADLYVARGLCGLLALIALETLISLILEIYRPRVKGKAARPLYESRLVGLLGQPEGLITTAAQALDYQFGFKVSETWFYQLFEKAFAWLLLLQLGVLFLSTTVVFVEPGEKAFIEHFGKAADANAVLEPGAHFKWPWPIDRVYRYPTEEVQSFNVGFIPDEKAANQTTVLWSVEHTTEDNFLVANRNPEVIQTTNNAAGTRTPPVSLLTVSIPVQFQVTNIIAWAYNNEDAAKLLQQIATREVVRYLVGADFNDVMSRDRGSAAETLRDRIQAMADARQLGARVVFVGMQDIHPPVKVAEAYENVIGAMHLKQARILEARAYEITTNALAIATATNIINVASAEAINRQISAEARATLFASQLPAFKAAPSVYTLRAYLQTFARASAGARKYVWLATNTTDVIQFDLQDKIREDILNLAVPSKNK